MMKLQAVMFILLVCFNVDIFAQIPKSGYIVNTLGENLSVIDLQNQSVNVNAANLGLYPNFVVLRNENGYVVNSGTNDIQVFSMATLNTLKTIDVGSGSSPYAMDFVNDSIAVVSLLFSNKVVFLNLNDEQILISVVVGNAPEGIIYYNGKVYVANSGFNGAGYDPGTISVIDVVDYTVNTIPVGLNPQSIDIDPQGNLIVACTGDYVSTSGQLDIIDPNIQAVTQSVQANEYITNVAVNGLSKAYLGTYNSSVLVYDLIQQTFDRDVSNPLPGGPAIDFDSDNNAYLTDFVNDLVYVYSPVYQQLNQFQVGDGPVSIAVYDPSFSVIGNGQSHIINGITLTQNYPNPFNPSTVIPFTLDRSGEVIIEVTDLLGRRVQTLLRRKLIPGNHSVKWNGENAAGDQVSAGVYFYSLEIEGHKLFRKMLLIR